MTSRSNPLLCAILCVLSLAATTLACLWDSDTLKVEADGLPGIAEILTGRFDRQPPRYYQMRLDRVTKLLESAPDNLDAYDDAGVACDRLGRSDEAIDWMHRKSAALARADQSSPKTKDHSYRYHANLGTFHAHRWLRSGASRDDLSDLKTADTEIAEGIRINPDAHFGREKYQLAAIRWLIKLPEFSIEGRISEPTFIMPFFDASANPDQRRLNAASAVKGLAGLIVMGDAWQSVDVHWALAVALAHHGDASLSRLAVLRIQELVSAGRKSLHPGFTQEYAEHVRNQDGDLYPDGEADVDRYFETARKVADSRNAARLSFMESRFDNGMHPDTHADFWKGWSEPSLPSMPNINRDPHRATIVFAVGASIFLFLLLGVIYFVRKKLPSAASAS